MRGRVLRRGVVAIGAVAILVASGQSQQTKSVRQQPCPVAVVDIEYICRHHHRLVAALKALEEERTRQKAGFGERKKNIKALLERLEMFRLGTPEYDNTLASIAKAKSELKVDRALGKREYERRRAELHAETCDEIYQAVNDFATKNRILLVVNFDSDALNGENLHATDMESASRRIRNPVVFQDRLNITNLLLETATRNE